MLIIINIKIIVIVIQPVEDPLVEPRHDVLPGHEAVLDVHTVGQAARLL